MIHRPEDAPAATAGLRFPIVIKPNVGGSGISVVRFDSKADLRRAVPEKAGSTWATTTWAWCRNSFRQGAAYHAGGDPGRQIPLWHPGVPVRRHIDLCPADIFQTGAGVALDNACIIEAPKDG